MANTLPSDAAERIAQRLDKAGPELFRALDEVREFGGTFLVAKIAHPRTGEIMQVLLAPPTFHLEPAPAAVEWRPCDQR